MLSSALPTYAVVIIIVVIAVQYAYALFCLLKLAYLDISKKEYVLWNLFILIVFFIGGTVFLIYWSKVKDEKRIPPYTPDKTDEPKSSDDAAQDPDTENLDESGENSEKSEEQEQNGSDAAKSDGEQ